MKGTLMKQIWKFNTDWIFDYTKKEMTGFYFYFF
jgi:hypothetical protein